LIHKQINPQPLVRRLKRLKLLDDEEFARWWLEQRASFRPKGKKALRQELLQKGLERSLIEELLAEVNEVAEAQKILPKKRLSPDKLASHLARQGFSWPTIKTVLGQSPRRAVDRW
jgi:regulatory protein